MHSINDMKCLTRVAIIAALYAAASTVTLLALGSLAWGPVQFRVSEALCVIALFTPDAILGLTIGCIVANGINIVFGGLGTLGLLDVVFGSFATALGAMFVWKFRNNKILALLGPVLANALIVPAYLPLLLQGVGFYTIPFTTISLDGVYLYMYLFGLCATAIGEAVVVYAIGLPLAKFIEKSKLFME